MQKKLLITVGGTGGHVFPAITLAKQMIKAIPGLQILFVGGGLSRNRYFERETFSYKDIPCGTLPLRKPITAFRNIFRIGKGVLTSRQIIKEFSPQLVVGFGSYHTLPMLLAAKTLGIPIVLHEANRIPGKVNRLMSPYAKLTGVHFPDTAKHLRGHIKEIPIPLREGYRNGTISKAKARAHFNLEPDRMTILSFGGSQGAHAVNFLVADALSGISSSKIQVLHFTGDPETTRKIRDKYADNGIPSCVKDFETRMDLAWQASDCVISRSGASTMSEELEFEVPGILIPYPFATENHQEFNADFMVENVGGAIKRIEKGLTVERLQQDIAGLLANDAKDIKTMKQAMSRYKTNVQPKNLSSIIQEMLT